MNVWLPWTGNYAACPGRTNLITHPKRNRKPGPTAPTEPRAKTGDNANPHRRSAMTARRLAWEILQQQETEGQWVEDQLNQRLSRSSLSEPDMRLARELCLGIIKMRSLLDFAIDKHVTRKRPEPVVRDLLRLGAYQLLCLDKIPPHAAVHETVDLAKRLLPEPQVKLVNAVLRTLGRQGLPALPDRARDVASHLSIQYSFPRFLVKRWLDRYPEEAVERMLEAANQAPPLVARINLARCSREKALDQLRQSGNEAEPGLLPEAVVITSRQGSPANLPGFQEGWIYFQDQASQMVGHIVDPQPGQTCLDLCSAPGGKATHLAERLVGQGQVLAADRSASKLHRVGDNARRLKLPNLKVIKELPANLTVDRVLVDAPCSNFGTLRRHAEVRWRMNVSDFSRLAEVQAGLLEQAARFVAPGGHLVYSTCTTEPEENEQVVRAFLQKHQNFKLNPGPGALGHPDASFWDSDGFFHTFPQSPEMDGMFAARLIRV